jgi:hypothetical protein
MLVSKQDIENLTGKVRYSAQAKWLREHGYKIDQRDDGSVILLVDELQSQLLSSPSRTTKKKRDWRPSLSVLDKAG